MPDLLPPFHKPMTTELDCHLANDRIAELEMYLIAKDNEIQAKDDAAKVLALTIHAMRNCGNCELELRHQSDCLRCHPNRSLWRPR